MNLELTCCESTLLREVADKSLRRADVAATYALAMRSRERASIDWGKVNAAILERWKMSGLLWIKRQAWKAATA